MYIGAEDISLTVKHMVLITALALFSNILTYLIVKMSSCVMFQKPTEQHARVWSDTGFWGHVTEMLAAAERVYMESLEHVGQIVRDRLAEAGAENDYTQDCKESMKLSDVLEGLQTRLRESCQRAEDNMHTLLAHQTNMERCSNQTRDKVELKVASHTYTDLLAAFHLQQRKVDKAKQKYEKAKQEEEQRKLCALRMDVKTNRARRLTQKVSEAEERAKLVEAKYRSQVKTAADSFNLLKSASKQYELTWKRHELTRSTIVLDFIQDYSSSCLKINAEPLIEDSLHRELMITPEFQERKNQLLSLVQTKLASNEDSDDLQGGREYRYTEYRKSQVEECRVTRPFKQKDTCCLLLKKEMKIIQLIPPSAKGWAFGEVSSKDHPPQYGFFPACCVKYEEKCTCRRLLAF